MVNGLYAIDEFLNSVLDFSALLIDISSALFTFSNKSNVFSKPVKFLKRRKSSPNYHNNILTSFMLYIFNYCFLNKIIQRKSFPHYLLNNKNFSIELLLFIFHFQSFYYHFISTCILLSPFLAMNPNK